MATGKIEHGVRCPSCTKLLNGFTGVSTDDKPSDGDVTVCVYCFSVCQYEKNLTNLRLLTQEELLKLKKENPEDFAMIKEAIRQVYMIHKNNELDNY